MDYKDKALLSGLDVTINSRRSDRKAKNRQVKNGYGLTSVRV